MNKQNNVANARALENKVILVTGGTRGIGLEIAETCAKEGAVVIICGRNLETTQKTALDISKKYNTDVFGLNCDVSSASDCTNLIKIILEKYKKIDCLVNNAGITADNLLLRMSEADWNNVIQTNLNSVFFMTKAVSRSMIKNKSGKIINITSVVGIKGNPGQANYAAAKAGIIGFTKTIAKELGSRGITCNAIAPGYIKTELIDSVQKDYIDNIIANIPLQRLGFKEEIANIVSFLISDKSNYITGQVLSVDGGMNI